MEGSVGRFWVRNRRLGSPKNRAESSGDAVAKWGAWRGASVDFRREIAGRGPQEPVSYTHLTLPTILLV
eukprot:512165-Pyramimonas_sp.AAC.1